MDTIFALATAHGRAGVAVVRISGPGAKAAGAWMCSGRPVPYRGLRSVRALDGDLIDRALILTFEAGASFTGEDVVELHLHGSVAVVARVLDELGKLEGTRHAEAGEFTRRALENGRLDLPQVEGLADLIDAETLAQQRQAARVMSGELGVAAERWRSSLVRAAALLEATIDFADEDVPVDVAPEVEELLSSVRQEMNGQIEGGRIAERVRSGFEVAIVGPPNTGKSTLLNRLAGRDAAITSRIAGTTRDVLEVRMDLDGIAVTILDTAGIRVAQDEVEAIGIQRAMDRAWAADLRVHLVRDGGVPEIGIEQDDLVLVPMDDTGAFGSRGISGATGQGLESLVAGMSSVFRRRSSGAGLAIRERHRVAMRDAIGHIDEVLVRVSGSAEMTEVLAEDVRFAIRSVESIVGRVDVEDLLGEIFESFCIGK